MTGEPANISEKSKKSKNQIKRSASYNLELKKLRELGIDISFNSLTTYVIEYRIPYESRAQILQLTYKIVSQPTKVWKKANGIGQMKVFFYKQSDRSSFLAELLAIDNSIKYEIGNSYDNLSKDDVANMFDRVTGGWSSEDDRVGTVATNLLFEKKQMTVEEIWNKCKAFGINVMHSDNAKHPLNFPIFDVVLSCTNANIYNKIKEQGILKELEDEAKENRSYWKVWGRQSASAYNFSFFSESEANAFSEDCESIIGPELLEADFIIINEIAWYSVLQPDDAMKFHNYVFGMFDSPEEEEGAFNTVKLMETDNNQRLAQNALIHYMKTEGRDKVHIVTIDIPIWYTKHQSEKVKIDTILAGVTTDAKSRQSFVCRSILKTSFSIRKGFFFFENSDANEVYQSAYDKLTKIFDNLKKIGEESRRVAVKAANPGWVGKWAYTDFELESEILAYRFNTKDIVKKFSSEDDFLGSGIGGMLTESKNETLHDMFLKIKAEDEYATWHIEGDYNYIHIVNGYSFGMIGLNAIDTDLTHNFETIARQFKSFGKRYEVPENSQVEYDFYEYNDALAFYNYVVSELNWTEDFHFKKPEKLGILIIDNVEDAKLYLKYLIGEFSSDDEEEGYFSGKKLFEEFTYSDIDTRKAFEIVVKKLGLADTTLSFVRYHVINHSQTEDDIVDLSERLSRLSKKTNGLICRIFKKSEPNVYNIGFIFKTGYDRNISTMAVDEILKDVKKHEKVKLNDIEMFSFSLNSRFYENMRWLNYYTFNKLDLAEFYEKTAGKPLDLSPDELGEIATGMLG